MTTVSTTRPWLMLVAVVPLLAACGGSGGPAFERLQWGDATASGNTLHIVANRGDCGSHDVKVTVRETATTVTVAAYQHSFKGMCDGLGVAAPKIVTLAAPLGHRTLLGCFPGQPNRHCKLVPGG